MAHGYKGDGSDNNAIRLFLANIANEYNCDQCPYDLGRGPQHPWGLPCGQPNCWVTLTCEDENVEEK